MNYTLCFDGNVQVSLPDAETMRSVYKGAVVGFNLDEVVVFVAVYDDADNLLYSTQTGSPNYRFTRSQLKKLGHTVLPTKNNPIVFNQQTVYQDVAKLVFIRSKYRSTDGRVLFSVFTKWPE